MKVHTMPTLRYGPIVVPGEWQIGVPEIACDCETMGIIVEAGLSTYDFAVAMQLVFERGMMKHIRDYIRYWARAYQKMHPDLQDPKSGVLAGFDPEDLMRYWLPTEKAWGKDNVEIRWRLTEYARVERRKG